MSKPHIHTHWDECWKDRKHHACAMRRIEELAQRVAELELENDNLNSALRSAYDAISGWEERLRRAFRMGRSGR